MRAALHAGLAAKLRTVHCDDPQGLGTYPSRRRNLTSSPMPSSATTPGV